VSQDVIKLSSALALVALIFMEATASSRGTGCGTPRRVLDGTTHHRRCRALVGGTIGLMGRRGECRQAKSITRRFERPEGCDFDRRDPCAAVARERIHHEVSVQPSVGVEDARNDPLHGFVPALRRRSRREPAAARVDAERSARGFHRLLPWGVWGFVANSVTGMLFFIGQAFQYIENPAFT
jgi:hypothetical protein